MQVHTAHAARRFKPIEWGNLPLGRGKIWALHQLQQFTYFRLLLHRSPLDQSFDDGLDFAVGQVCVSYPMQFMA